MQPTTVRDVNRQRASAPGPRLRKANCALAHIRFSTMVQRPGGTWPGVIGECFVPFAQLPYGPREEQHTTTSRMMWMSIKTNRGCATKGQIAGLVETTGNDPTKAPGYQRLSAESQEQVRLAFELGVPADKGFKGIREDLAKNAQKYAKEYMHATGYKVDVAVRAAACRGGDCLDKGVNIKRNELRLGIWVPFGEDHSSLVYKHWVSGLDCCIP